MANTLYVAQCDNDPNGNKAALAQLSNGAVRANQPATATGSQSLLSALANGSHEHGKAPHAVSG